MNNTTTISRIRNYIFLALSFAIVVAFLSLSRYALPKTDDFADMMYGYQSLEQTGNIYKTSWNITQQMYTNQQGTYSSVYALIFLLVKTGTNLIRYQKIIAVLAGLLFVSYLYLLLTIAKHFHFDSVWGVFLFSALWVAVDLIGPGEGMLYIVGSCVYALPMALGFLATAFYLNLMESKKMLPMILWTILSMGCAILGAGGVLMVSAMINIFMVWIFLSRWILDRKFPIRGILPFWAAFGGALANALAPGNFNRYSSATGEKPDYLASVLNTFGVNNEQLWHLFSHTYFLVACLLIAVFVLLTKTKLTKEDYRIHPIVMAVACYISCYIVIFPTVLGYQLSVGERVEERIILAFAWIAAINVFLTWTYLLFWLKARFLAGFQVKVLGTAVAAVVLALGIGLNVMYLPLARPEETTPTLTTIYNEYTTGALDNYYAAYHLALLGADAMDVSGQYYIFYEFPESKLFMNSSMSSDPQWWVNYTAGAVYQLALFAYCPDHPFSEADVIEAGYTMEQLLP